MPSDFEIFFHDVHHHVELGEDEHFVALPLHLRQHVVQQPELARLANNVVTKTEML